MKKEELLDLITEFKPDDAFVEEALGEREGAPVKVYAGNYKRSPLKIIAPIAACLAVVIGTGAVVSRLNKPKQSENSEEQQSVQEQVDPKAFVQVDFEGKDLKEIYNSNVIELDFEPEEIDRDFIAECISMIKNENEAALQDGITWQVIKPDDYCGWSGWDRDYYILPRIDGHAVADIGVRVFHRTKGYSSIYGETFDVMDHGGFGKGYEDLDLDYVVANDPYANRYYYRTDTNGSETSESIRKIMYNSKDEIYEETLMEKVTDGDTITYINERKKIGEEEFVGIWNTYAFIPKFYTEFTNEEVEECREMLKEELGIPDTLKVRWIDAEVDIDLDGTKELLLSPNDSEDFKGVYVYAKTSSGIKEVGSFDTEYGVCIPEKIMYSNEGADEYFPYYVYSEDVYPEDNTWKGYLEHVEKILVDEDGNITTEAILEEGTKSFDKENRKFVNYYKVYGEEVSAEKFFEEWHKYVDYNFDHEYHKSTVPTDPANYAWD